MFAEVIELALPGALVPDPAPRGSFLTMRPKKIISHVLSSLHSRDFIMLPCPFLPSLCYFFAHGCRQAGLSICTEHVSCLFIFYEISILQGQCIY